MDEILKQMLVPTVMIFGLLCAAILFLLIKNENLYRDYCKKLESFEDPIVGIEYIDYLNPNDMNNYDEFNKVACLMSQILYCEMPKSSAYEESLLIWCILNRLDSHIFGDTLTSVIESFKFERYKPYAPINKHQYKLVIDILMRWTYELYCVGDVGRTLPKDYIYYYIDKNNEFQFKNSNDRGVFTKLENNIYSNYIEGEKSDGQFVISETCD